MSQFYNPWADAAGAMAGGVRGMADVLMQAPALRAQAAMRQQQMAQSEAQTGLIKANTELATKKAAGMDRQQQGIAALADEINGAITTDGQGRFIFDANKAPNVARLLVQSSTGGNDSARSLSTFMASANKVPQSDVDAASRAKQALEVQAAKDKAAGERGFVLQPGAARYDATGKLMVERPSAASEQEQFDTIREEYPATAEKLGKPAVPAKKHWFSPDEPEQPAVPGTPAQPARVVTRKIPRGQPAGMAGALATPTVVPQPPASEPKKPIYKDASGIGQNSGVGTEMMIGGNGKMVDVEQELAMANEALAANVPFETISALFKQRTGRDLKRP